MAHTPRVATLAVNAEADAVAALLDGGEVRVYDGAQPATADAPVTTQTLIVAFALGSPAFGAAVGGVATANPIAPATAVADGTAAWFRTVTSGGAAVVDGSVGTADADMILATTLIGAGAEVTLNSYTYTAVRQ